MKYILGIEQSGTQLKIAAFKKTSKNNVLVALERISPDDLKTWVAANLKNATSITGYATVAESLVYLKDIELPKASKKHLENAIHWEVSASSPIPLDAAVYDYKILEKDQNNVRIVAMLLKSKISEELFEVYKEAGVKLQSIEPSSLALSRITKIDNRQNTLILTVEEEETNLLVLQNGYPVFTTSVAIEIEQAKNNRRRLSENVIENLSSHTKRIVDYWQEKSGKIINQIIITGDISQRYYGLATSINKFAKIPVISAKQNPKIKFDYKDIPETQISRYYLSIGAALRNLDQKETINFLPTEEKSIQEQKKVEKLVLRFLKTSVSVLAVILLLMLGFYGSRLLASKDLTRQINQTQQFVENHPGQALIADANKTNTAVENINKLMKSQKDLGNNLRIVNDLKPSDLQIDSIDFSQLEFEEFSIKGTADRDSILAFYDQLTANTDAKEITMPYSNFEKQKDNDFEIKIQWK